MPECIVSYEDTGKPILASIFPFPKICLCTNRHVYNFYKRSQNGSNFHFKQLGFKARLDTYSKFKHVFV